MWWAHGFNSGWMMFGGLMMFVFWGGLIISAVWAVRAFLGARSPGATGQLYARAPRQPEALEILQERYAQGELSTAEYEEMREDLKL